MLDTATLPPKDPTAPKEWYRSITVWFNAISAVVVIGGVFLDPSLGFDPRVIAIATAVITAGNAALRIMKTNSAILGTPAAAQAEVAKQDIAIHAALSAAPAPVVVPAQPTLDDLPGLVALLKQRRASDDALLAQLAGIAATTYVAGTAGATPAPTTTG